MYSSDSQGQEMHAHLQVYVTAKVSYLHTHYTAATLKFVNTVIKPPKQQFYVLRKCHVLSKVNKPKMEQISPTILNQSQIDTHLY